MAEQGQKERVFLKYIAAPILVAGVTALITVYTKSLEDDSHTNTQPAQTPASSSATSLSPVPSGQSLPEAPVPSTGPPSGTATSVSSPKLDAQNRCAQPGPWTAVLDLGKGESRIYNVEFTGSAIRLQPPLIDGRQSSFDKDDYYFYPCTSDGDLMHLGPQLTKGFSEIRNFHYLFLPSTYRWQENGTFLGVFEDLRVVIQPRTEDP